MVKLMELLTLVSKIIKLQSMLANLTQKERNLELAEVCGKRIVNATVIYLKVNLSTENEMVMEDIFSKMETIISDSS